MKNLPAGESSFSAIRLEDWLYIDKTEHIHKLLQQGKFYFLSRPRRFGKSLTVSTLKALFEGRKDLFQGLWIYDKIEWEQHPVIHFSFAGLDYKKQDFEITLRNAMDLRAAESGLTLRDGTAKQKLYELIMQLSAQGNVVVLIDEYDKPINDYLHDYEQSDKNRDTIGNVLGVLKDGNIADRLRFVFVTGVSKFSKVTLFSELNNLTDLTHHRKFPTMLGITQEELERDFASYIEALGTEMRISKTDLLAKIKHWYNGYSWDGKNFVYNPFSLLHLFGSGEFSNYWFTSGTTSWLVKNFHAKQADIARFEDLVVGAEFFEKFEVKNLEPSVLLYQTGYLTIKKVETDGDDKYYHLGYPNHEVRHSLFKSLFAEYAELQLDQLSETMRKLESTLLQNNLPTFIDLFKTIFADISNRLLRQYVQQNSLQLWEAYYQTVIYLALNLTGSRIACEVQTNKGYIDAVAETDKYIYIMEFKVGKAEDAMQQIKDKGYFEKYSGKGKTVLLLGIGFDPEERNIGGWLVEEV